MYAYTGCRTTRARNARGNGIEVYEIRGEDWFKIQTLETIDNPSYLCFDQRKEYLYSVHGDLTKVSSYKIGKDGKLEFLNEVDIGGKNPVFITVDRANEFLVVATLQGGTLYSIRREQDGRLGEIYDRYVFEGKEEGWTSFAHQCLFDHNLNYIFVPTQARGKGYERLNLIHYDCGRFRIADYFDARLYSEPRHVSIHKNNCYVYLTNEKGNDLTYLSFDSEKGTLMPRQTLPTIPETFTGVSDVSAVIISHCQQFLFVSNRFSDLITSFRINQETGYVTPIQYTPCLGLTPRFMTLGTEEGTLYCANEESDTIVEFRYDDSGFLTFTGRMQESLSPVCLIFSR